MSDFVVIEKLHLAAGYGQFKPQRRIGCHLFERL